MSSGWIKLHRQFLEWEWYDDTNTKCLFLHCLLRANHTDTEWRGHKIKRGQFLTSVDTLTRETGLTVSQIRTSLKKLISTSEIATKSQARSTIITVVEYNSHQGSDKPDDKLMTMKSQADDNEIATDKNLRTKELKNNSLVEDSPQPSKYKFTDIDYQCAEWVFGLIKNIAPSSKKPNFESWANTIRLMRESDKLTHDDISNVFTWANSDPFWSVNILSVTKLRKQFPQLQAKMKGANNGQHQSNGKKLSAYERARAANAEYRQEQPNEREVVVGTDDGYLGRTVDEGAGRATIEYVDNGTFIDYDQSS
jgi:hypothetical protein